MCRLYLGSFPQITIRYYYWYQLIIRNSEKLFKKIRMKFKFKTDNNSNKGGGGTSSSLGTLSRFKSKFKIKFNIQNLSIKNFFLRILYPTLNSFPNMLCIWAGFGIVSYIIYVRLILQHLPRELFIKDISIISIIIYFNLFATFFILSTISGYKVYKEHFNKEKVNKEKEGENQGVNGKIERILVWLKGKGVKISNFYTLCLLKFDKAFKNIIYKIFNVNRVLLPEYALNFMNKFVPLSRYNIIIITFAVMPKVIIIASLLMDIFIFHKLNYFYICGPLYLIPLGFDWIVHTLVQAPLDALRAADKLIVISKDTVLQDQDQEGEGEVVGEEIMTPTEFVIKKVLHQEQFNIDDYYFSFTSEFAQNLDENDEVSKNPVKYLEEMSVYIDDKLGRLFNIMLDFVTWKGIKTIYWNLLIYIMFAICWGFVLVKSIIIII